MRIRIDRRKRGRGRFQLCLKLILRHLLPGNRSIVRQIVGGPICQRSLFGAARLSVSNGAIRDAPILRHTSMLKSRAAAIKLFRRQQAVSLTDVSISAFQFFSKGCLDLTPFFSHSVFRDHTVSSPDSVSVISRSRPVAVPMCEPRVFRYGFPAGPNQCPICL